MRRLIGQQLLRDSYLIGGNWKANGTLASNAALVKTLNEGGIFPLKAEVRPYGPAAIGISPRIST